jgi:hypothetical protein
MMMRRVRNLLERRQDATIDLPVHRNASAGVETTGGCHQKTVPEMACQKRRFSKIMRQE